MFILSHFVYDKILGCYTKIGDQSILWAQLRQAYACNTTTQINILKRKISCLHFHEGASMFEDLSITKEPILNKLVAIGIFSDDELIGLILNALPPNWETFWAIVTHKNLPPMFIQLKYAA